MILSRASIFVLLGFRQRSTRIPIYRHWYNNETPLLLIYKFVFVFSLFGETSNLDERNRVYSHNILGFASNILQNSQW